MASELLDKAPEKERIAKSLIDIAVKRLHLHLDSNRSDWVQVSSGGSLLTNYLETVNARKDDAIVDNVRSSSIEQLYKLSYKIFQIASMRNFSDSRSLRLAGQLLDTSLLLRDNLN